MCFRGQSPSEPKAIARLIRKHARDVVRVGLESGPTSVWLTHTLLAEGLPVVCLDARHAQAVLSVRPNKSDRSDARGLAEMVRVGWFKARHALDLHRPDRSSTIELRASGELSLPGRRVEMTAHRALFAGTTITEQFAPPHCSIATPGAHDEAVSCRPRREP